MLIKASATKGYHVAASDGSLGTVSDMLFDDATWTVRWLVVETGTWLANRQVLLPASVLGQTDGAARSLSVHLTMAQVRDSPDVDSQLPVSRQQEVNIYDYYGFSPYWGAADYSGDFGYWNGMRFSPPTPSAVERHNTDSRVERAPDDPHLRSIHVLQGYHIHATDGEIGHLADILLEDSDWALRYLVINTSNWWQGKEVLISPRSTQSIHWGDRMIYLSVTRDKVRAGPDYDASAPLPQDFDAEMARHYGPPDPATAISAALLPRA
jgi:uncharacterized protein YrrD